MIICRGTSAKIQVVTGSAGTIDAYAAWIDYTDAATTAVPGQTNTAAISTATTTDIVAAPSGSTVSRNVKYLSIFNSDASVSNAIKVMNTDGTNNKILWSGTLLANESVVCDAAGDWIAYDASGRAKQVITSFASITPVVVLSILSNTITIDLSQGDYFTCSLNANITTITISNAPTSGKATTFMIRFQQDATGSRTVALPSSFKAISGSDTAVQAAANAYTILSATSFDQGARWEYSMHAGAV